MCKPSIKVNKTEVNPVNDSIVAPLLNFFSQTARDLPWRRTKDPYAIWVSEIMLQQTRVETVIPYYERFISTLPTIQALAKVDDALLYKLWEGLGYYSRVKNMRKAAQQMVSQGLSTLPSSYESLLKLPGIGSYTAGAIASIAFGQPVPAVDGNVLRVIARITADYTNILDPKFKTETEKRLISLVPSGNEAGQFNQSLIELGALICQPNGIGSIGPHCESCPLAFCCQAHINHCEKELPIRVSTTQRIILPKTVLLIYDNQKVCIRKRPDTGLLAGLYEFPTWDGWLSSEEVTSSLRSLGLDPLRIYPLPEARHVFSHREWHMHGFGIELADDIPMPSGQSEYPIFSVSIKELGQTYPLPSAFSTYKKLLNNNLGG